MTITLSRILKCDYSEQVVKELSVNEEKDVKQFLFDSCPDKMKSKINDYLIWLKKAEGENLFKDGIRDGIIVQMELIAGRCNTNFSHNKKSQSL